MAELENFWVDGEKIPDARLSEVFQTPPDATSQFLRCALVIGARGAGKTTLFRHLKESHTGVGIHLSLAAELGCIQKETGLGPLAKECPHHLQLGLPGKTISLLAIAFCERAVRKGVNIPQEALLECLPLELRTQTKQIAAAELGELKERVVATRVESFGGLSHGRPLSICMSALGKASNIVHGPLLVLLDRAEMVNAQCLLPIFELLDQPSDYTALVAMRPGHSNEAIEEIARHVVPGDHYTVVHLGLKPRSEIWHTFVQESVRAQAAVLGLKGQFDRIPKEIRSWITILSRDSVRTALELYARYLNVERKDGEKELVDAIEDAKDGLLIATQPSLQKFSPDFRTFTNDIRAEATKTEGHLIGPLYLTLKQKPKEDLFSDSSGWLNRFVQDSLRCGAFCMPPGQRWVPGLHPTEVEVSPLLTWHKSDPHWSNEGDATYVIRDESNIRGSYGRSKLATVFVAYRMRSDESKRFRSGIEEELRSRGDLSTLAVTDGSVPAGTAWAPEIRSRIADSKAVIGDVTQVSSEVLFEMGFAYGLKKITIGAIADLENRNELPAWLSITQLGAYGTPAGLSALVASIAAHLRDPDLAKLPEPKQPVPELIVLLRRFTWNSQAYDQAHYLAQQSGLTFIEFSLDDGTPYETIIQRAASASLLVVSLDGTEADALMHYICGAVLAKPQAQVAGKRFRRRVLIIANPHARGKPLVADSVLRCLESKLISVEQLKEEAETFAATYEEWVKATRKEK